MPQSEAPTDSSPFGSGWNRLPYWVFWLYFLGVFFPSISPAAALLDGTIFALIFGNPYAAKTRKYSKYLLQVSVVLLGFSFDLGPVLTTGAQGAALSAITIVTTFCVGWFLSRKILKVDPLVASLVCAGTAICGGSAIAALGATLGAKDEDIGISAAVIFLLNALALLIFPPLGHSMGLAPHAFGTWAGLAIHDVASVAGAAEAFGGGAIDTAIPVKLSRVLWIVPICAVAAWWRSRQSKASGGPRVSPLSAFPWFIVLFAVASGLRTLWPEGREYFVPLGQIAKVGFKVTLFLIGTGFSQAALKRVGVRALGLAGILWILASLLSLGAIRHSGEQSEPMGQPPAGADAGGR